MTRVAVTIDLAVTSGQEADETGIVVAGKDKNGYSYVLPDISGRYQPIEWARFAIAAYPTHRADLYARFISNFAFFLANQGRNPDEPRLC
jgi:phage terminase large subunit-like protein